MKPAVLKVVLQLSAALQFAPSGQHWRALAATVCSPDRVTVTIAPSAAVGAVKLVVATPLASKVIVVASSVAPLVLSVAVWPATEVAVEIVSGRDVSANFDMQSLASLLHGDRILVQRSEHSVRFLHPLGWNYFATLRKKLRWNEGGS